jgi:uncharacterized protein (TIGR04255 family)
VDFPHLPKAPIIEGLIAIQTKVASDVAVSQLVKFGDRIRSSYPTVKELREFQAHVAVVPNQATSQSVVANHVGYRYERQAPPFVVHARPNELLVSRLKPYDCWENLVAEAKSLWEEYCAVCKPEAITRIATRFINRIELPMDGLEFDDYLVATPIIPKGLPQTFEGFLTRIVVPHSETGAHIAMSQILDTANPQTRTVPVIIDIDVFKELDLPADSPALWEFLAKMRDVKNRAFFDSVTPRCLELFK